MVSKVEEERKKFEARQKRWNDAKAIEFDKVKEDVEKGVQEIL